MKQYKYYIYGGLLALGVGGLILALRKKGVFGLSSKTWSDDINFFKTSNGVNLLPIGSKAGIK